jgi:hypothetical protein
MDHFSCLYWYYKTARWLWCEVVLSVSRILIPDLIASMLTSVNLDIESWERVSASQYQLA